MAFVFDARGHLSSVVARTSVPRFRTPTTADVTEPSPRMNAAPSAGILRAFRMESSRWAIALSPDCASAPVAATHSTRTVRMQARFIVMAPDGTPTAAMRPDVITNLRV